MKRDLERFKDKMTPEEERLVWSKMRDGIQKGKSGRTSWLPRLWMSRVAVAAAAVLAAAVIWQADLLTPDRVAKDELAVSQRTTGSPDEPNVAGAEKPAAFGRTEIATEDRDATAEAARPEAEPSAADAARGAQAKGKDPGTDAVATPIEPTTATSAEQKTLLSKAGSAPKEEPTANGVMMKVPPDRRVHGDGATVTPEEKEQAMPKTDYFAEEDAAGVRRGAEARWREDTAADSETTEPNEQAEKAKLMMAETAAPLAAKGQASAEGMAGQSAKKADLAGAGEIRGRVTDSKGNPFAYIRVTLKGTRYGAMTDSNGNFRIRNVPAGTYSVIVVYSDSDELVIPDVVVDKGEINDLAEVEVKDATASPADRLRADSEADFYALMSSVQEPQSEVTVEKEAATGQALGPRREKKADRLYGAKRYPSLTGGRVPVNDELADDMFFRHYGANPFVDAEEDALSTFALDVDTGSYTICRRYIFEGHLPPPEAVRVEEFVNFFQKDLEPPRRDAFRIHIDAMPSPFAHVQDGNYYLLRIAIKGRVIDDRDRKPAQIVLVIDTSGSMGMGNRLPLLKKSMKVLLGELYADDEIGIVEFGSQARVVLPLTPLSEDRAIYRAIESLEPNGSTNAEHGLKLGYKMLRESARRGFLHRIIFCSDGVANVGNTGWESILESVRRESDEISLTTIGFGMGNYNDILMEQLADAGDGQYAYVDNMREAKRVLREHLTGTLQTIAKDTKAQIEFYPKYVVKYRLLGYENRDIRDEDFRDDDIDAGEIGAGHEVTILYEVKLQEKLNKGRMATVFLRYEDPETGRVVELDEPVSPGFVTREFEDTPADLVVDACVAEFAEILRGSYWAKDSSFEDVLDLLDDATERMTSRPDVDELRDLLEKAIVLADKGERPRRDYREE